MRPELIAEADRLATGCRLPDRTLFFGLPPDEAQRRRSGREADRIDRESLAFYRRVDPDRFRLIDATGPIETVAVAVNEALDDLLAPPEPDRAAGA